MSRYVTRFGSLAQYEKGGFEVIAEDPRSYVFSNLFEVVSVSAPYEKVAVARNIEYVLEVLRTEGTSTWRAAAHDEFALVMDGEVEVRLVKPNDRFVVAPERQGSIELEGEPLGRRMGVIRAQRGHMVLLPAGAAYRFHADRPGVILLQTIGGGDTRYRWATLAGQPAAWDWSPAGAASPRPRAVTDFSEAVSAVRASEPGAHGYRSFSIGQFTFSRDEYLVHVTWPAGRHVMSADAFLRALQRDVAWSFSYGIVFLDDVIGTANHRDTVDLFAGRDDAAYRNAGVAYVEDFSTPLILATFTAMLDDWTPGTFDPCVSPQETGTAFGCKYRSHRTAPAARWVAATRMVGVPGDELLRSDATGHPVNRQFLDVPQGEPPLRAEPAFEGEVRAFNLFAYLSRCPVTWNPSVVSVCKDSLLCPAVAEHILPVIHGSDRLEWFVQLSDETYWEVEDQQTGAIRATVLMKPGDVVAMPIGTRHRGYSPKRAMLLVWVNADSRLAELSAAGRAPATPVTF